MKKGVRVLALLTFVILLVVINASVILADYPPWDWYSVDIIIDHGSTISGTHGTYATEPEDWIAVVGGLKMNGDAVDIEVDQDWDSQAISVVTSATDPPGTQTWHIYGIHSWNTVGYTARSENVHSDAHYY